MSSFFTVLFTLCIVFTIGKECGPAWYKTDADECCPMCGKGFCVRKDCTSYSRTTCIPCIRGTYMDEPNGLIKCHQCQTCDTRHGLIFLQEYNTTSNAFCDVKDGFYCKSYSNNECNFALKHSPCTPGRYPKVPGTKTADTLCEECPDGYFSTNGINCTAWTKCNFDQRKTTEGSKIKDTVCENIPKRNRTYLLLSPLIATALLLLALIGIYLWTKNQLKLNFHLGWDPVMGCDV